MHRVVIATFRKRTHSSCQKQQPTQPKTRRKTLAARDMSDRRQQPTHQGPNEAMFAHTKLPAESIGRVFAFAWTLKDAVEKELADVVKVLIISKEAKPRADLMDGAAKKGSLSLVRVLHYYSTAGCTPKAMDNAAGEGNLEVVRFLHGNRTEGCTVAAMNNALQSRHTDVVKFLAKYRKEKWTDAPMKWAAERNDLEVIQDLLRNNPGVPTSEAKVIAFKAGRTEILKYMYEHGEDTRPTFNLVTACENDDFEMVKYLCGREGFVKAAMNEAVCKGSLAIVKYLHENARNNHTDASRVVSMNEAAANGHLEVLKYLHENAPELACTVKAMDMAASRGHLDVVMFLHENRTEGCTERAMDSAAVNGHLEVVRYLHERRTEGCTTKAMDYAAVGNHLEVLEFLHRNGKRCTAKAFNDSALLGHVRIVDFLLKNCTEICDVAKGISLAKQRYYVDVIAVLEAHQAATEAATTATADP